MRVETALLMSSLVGCMHAAVLNPTEICGAQNMVLAGTTSGESAGTAGESSSREVSCRRPETSRDGCEIRAATESIASKERSGDDHEAKRVFFETFAACMGNKSP